MRSLSDIDKRSSRNLRALGSIKTQAIHSFIFFFREGYNTGGRCFPPPSPAAVNSPIAESEHHNFRCRALRPKRYFFRVFPLSAMARATKDAIIAKPCMRSDRSFSRAFREQTTMRGVAVDIVASGAQFLRQRKRVARSYFSGLNAASLISDRRGKMVSTLCQFTAFPLRNESRRSLITDIRNHSNLRFHLFRRLIN